MRPVFHLSVLFALAAFLVSLAPAQEKAPPKPAEKTWSGYLVDKNCGVMIGKKEKEKAMEMGKKHSVACALDEACMASGYGIIHEGQFVKFDSDGDAIAAKYFKGLTKKNDVFVTVSGTLDGETIRVTKIADAQSPTKPKS